MTETSFSFAWLGTGLMGEPMAKRLIAQGYTLWVWNRTPARTKALVEQGARLAATPAEAVAASCIAFTMLSDFAAIQDTLRGVELAGKTLVQMATIAPSESRRLAERVAHAGGTYLEAPVLGSIPEARDGSLLIMVGGQEKAFLTLRPVLKHLGQVHYIGEVGKAAALKLALNQLIATLTVAFATSLAFVQEHQVAVETFMEILRKSALYASTFDKKLGRMQAHDYSHPNFPTEHLLKDIDLFRCEAKATDTRMLEAARDLYLRALAGHGREDYSCVFEAVFKGEASSV